MRLDGFDRSRRGLAGRMDSRTDLAQVSPHRNDRIGLGCAGLLIGTEYADDLGH